MAFTTLDTNSSLSPADAGDLARTARWARITAIAGAAWLVVMMAGGGLIAYITYQRLKIMSQSQEALGMPANEDPFVAVLTGFVFFLIVVALYVMPIVFLFQYAQRTLNALRTGFEGDTYSESLRAQRNLFTYCGVLSLVMLAGTLIALASVAYGMFVLANAGPGQPAAF